MSIIIGADIVPTKSNIFDFESGCLTDIIDDDLINLLASVDYRVFNLEVPLVDIESKIDKAGPNLIASVKSCNGLKSLNVNLFTLANNHIMDQGVAGLISTMNTLKKHCIDYVGVGENLQDAERTKFVDLKGKRIGFYACCEHEFSIASETTPGANPVDYYNLKKQIQESKDSCDYLIVLYHGGKEHYRYPSPNLQNLCRKIIDAGADLVICQHNHCIGSAEVWGNGTIVYGQGNFLFDSCDNEFWNTGLLIYLDDFCNVRYIPIIKHRNGVRLANNQEKEELLKQFEKRNGCIKDPIFVKKTYAEYSKNYLWNYTMMFRNESLFFKIINKIMKNKLRICAPQKLNKENLLAMKNFIECDAHREMFIEGITELLRRK